MVVMMVSNREFDEYRNVSLDDTLNCKFELSKEGIELVVKYMYLSMMDFYYRGLDEDARNEVIAVNKSLKDKRIEPRQFDLDIIQNDEAYLIRNWLYLLTPVANIDYSGKRKIGSFAQLRADMLSGWYPE